MAGGGLFSRKSYPRGGDFMGGGEDLLLHRDYNIKIEQTTLSESF